jgi:hypothetical protein
MENELFQKLERTQKFAGKIAVVDFVLFIFFYWLESVCHADAVWLAEICRGFFMGGAIVASSISACLWIFLKD